MKNALVIFLSFLVICTYGCESNKTRVAEGAVIGGLIGGAAGGIIGHQSGHGGEGAGIGIAAGALTGALVGSQINKPQSPEAQNAPVPATSQQPAQPAPQVLQTGQLSMQQIVDMAKKGVSDDEIIKEIKSTNSKFNLSQEGINYLKNAGVSDRVIAAMQGN
ncbi:MAG: glycine zipper 2TM domain-containing protein [Candidatus Omnitrophica bacterium]|nr:glycine zipper 2TM domain-containing protein [Candidatus Omnitrophota bacterium]